MKNLNWHRELSITHADWKLYDHLRSRFPKYYKYSLQDITSRLHYNDMDDIQRWRRRINQRRYELALLADCVDHQVLHKNDKNLWMMVRGDIEYWRAETRLWSTAAVNT